MSTEIDETHGKHAKISLTNANAVMIYVIEILNQKWIKIGFSEEESCRVRLSQLQTGNPFELKLLMTANGTLRQEQSIHAALKTAFGRAFIPTPPNEWYPGLHPISRETIDALKYGANNCIAYLSGRDPAVRQPGSKGSPFDHKSKFATKA